MSSEIEQAEATATAMAANLVTGCRVAKNRRHWEILMRHLAAAAIDLIRESDTNLADMAVGQVQEALHTLDHLHAMEDASASNAKKNEKKMQWRVQKWQD